MCGYSRLNSSREQKNTSGTLPRVRIKDKRKPWKTLVQSKNMVLKEEYMDQIYVSIQSNTEDVCMEETKPV